MFSEYIFLTRMVLILGLIARSILCYQLMLVFIIRCSIVFENFQKKQKKSICFVSESIYWCPEDENLTGMIVSLLFML